MRFRHLLLISSFALSGLSVAPLVHAETPPDVVMLKNGGMLRGTISEMDPQGSVVVALSSGEQRTIAMSEVKYAGPATEAPSSQPAPAPPVDPVPAPHAPPPGPTEGKLGGSQPLVTVHGSEARLQLRGEGLTFQRDVGSGTGAEAIRTTIYEGMCTAPCEISMPRGTYSLALSKDGKTIPAYPVTVDTDGTLEGKYISESRTRTLGWVVGLLGSAAGTALIFTSLDDGAGGVNESRMLVGSGIMTAALVIGFVLVTTSDKAEIRFIPGAPVSLTHPNDLRADSGAGFRGLEPGLSLAMNF